MTDKKPKLLWVADFAAMTGFGRVSGAILPRLKDNFEIVVLACNWHGDPVKEQEDFKMYPAANRHRWFQPGICHDDCRAKFRLRQIRERKRHENYEACCRCDHAASSSARFQSSAKAASLSSVASWASEGSSSRIVTSARCRRSRWSGLSRRTAPCSSTMASMV